MSLYGRKQSHLHNLKKDHARTLPETNSSHLKMVGWNTNFLLGFEPAYFQGLLLLVSGRVQSESSEFANLLRNTKRFFQHFHAAKLNLRLASSHEVGGKTAARNFASTIDVFKNLPGNVQFFFKSHEKDQLEDHNSMIQAIF